MRITCTIGFLLRTCLVLLVLGAVAGAMLVNG